MVMPLLRWGWKETGDMPKNKTEANERLKVPTYWSTLGPVGCERMSKMFQRGAPRATCYLTISTMTSIKVSLEFKCRLGMVLTRPSGVGVPILVKAPMDELQRMAKRHTTSPTKSKSAKSKNAKGAKTVMKRPSSKKSTSKPPNGSKKTAKKTVSEK